MNSLVALTAVIVVWNGLIQTECTVYHAAFLWRNPLPTNDLIGQLHYQGQLTEPPIVIDEVNCTWAHEAKVSVENKIGKISADSDCRNLISNGFKLSPTGFKVSSSSNFTLHVYQSDSSGDLADGYLAIPDEHLGTEYVVPTYCTLGGYCQIAVVGTIDETSLNIVFPENITPGSVTCNEKAIVSGDPIPFTLNENDVLHIESKDERNDLSGIYVSSDKNIAVFIGARDGQNESSMIEQIPPTSKWGTELVVAQNYLSEAGDVIKIITKTADTTIHISGYSPFTLSKAREWKEFRIDWDMPSTITATEPVLVLQIMSLDLYNDTSIVPGKPAMVIVPNIEQRTTESIVSNCLQNDKSVVTTVASSSAGEYITGNIKQHINEVSGYSVKQHVGQSTVETILGSSEIGRSIYGYCDGKSAVLLGANWAWNNEECVRSRAVPGDGLDNDCDGNVDEDNCTMDDLYVKFTSTPTSPSGEVNYKKLNVEGASPIHISVRNCDVAAVSFRVSSDPSMTFSIHIGSTSVSLLLTCPGGCEKTSDSLPPQPIGSNCAEVEQTFTVRWNVGDSNTTVQVDGDNGETRILTAINQQINFDEMYMAAFFGTASFSVALPEKDCGKITSGDDADNYGMEFIVPKDASKIFLTNVGDTNVDATLMHEDGSYYKTIPIRTQSTMPEELTSTDKALFIRATGELSVYALYINGADSTLYGYSILPVDVFGPYYHVNTSGTGQCTFYTFSEYSESKVVIESDTYEYEGYQEMFKSNPPGALFCGFDNHPVQIPPHDSLGTQYYIPSLSLGTDETALISLISTEDSTVVIIRGNYDNLDTIELTGNIFNRKVVPNMLYNISSTKPIQVLLQIQKSTTWTSVVPVPSVEQYKSKHMFPDILKNIGTFTFDTGASMRSFVYDNGTEGEAQLGEPPNMIYDYDINAFVLYILSYESTTSSQHIKLIVPGDVMYNRINKVCRITKGFPGDNEDNDCDGLTDEEQCTVNIIPGQIDSDIDGSPNDDCANGSDPPTSTIILDVPQQSVQCPDQNGVDMPNETDDVTNRITIDNGNVPNVQKPSSYPPKAVQYGKGPSYKPIASNGGSSLVQNLFDTETTQNSTNSTEDTSACDCVCPCGWVDPPKNYTVQELKAVVVEIQEKLKVSKASLSSTVRSKSSAKDDRTEASAVGIVGVVFLVSLLGAIFLLDLTTIARDVRMLMGNIRQVFQP